MPVSVQLLIFSESYLTVILVWLVGAVVFIIVLSLDCHFAQNTHETNLERE